MLVWDPAHPGAGRPSWAATTARCVAVAVLPDGRVVTGGDDGRVLVWDPALPARPGGAGPPRRPGEGGGGAGRRAGGHRRVRRAGAGVGPGPSRAARPSWAATTARCVRWRCCPTGGWSPAETTGGCWSGTGCSRRGPAELGRHDGGVRAVAVLADGRVVTGGYDGRVLVWDPARPGRPGRAGPPRRRGERGGGAARRAGGQRRARRAGAGVGPGRIPGDPAELGRHDGWVNAVAVLADGRVVTGGDDGRVLVWDPAEPGRPGRAGPPSRRGAGGGGAARWAGGQRRARRAGAGVGPDRSRRDPAELGPHDGGVGAVAVLAGRAWWSPAGPTGGCWCGTSTRPGRPGRAGPPRRRGAGGGGAGRSGRVVTGGSDGRVLVWDPAHRGAGPAELGAHEPVCVRWRCCPMGGWSAAETMGGCWCGTPDPWRGPAELGSHHGGCGRWRCCPDGRVVTGGLDGRVLVWDPTRPGSARSSSAPTTAGCRSGGAARWAGGHRRRPTGGCWCGTRSQADTKVVQLSCW